MIKASSYGFIVFHVGFCSLPAIEKAINKSDVGLTPNNDGNLIRLNVPQLTADRRKVEQYLLVKPVTIHLLWLESGISDSFS